MNPDTRMAVSLVMSLAVSGPNLRLAVTGRADIVDVGLRYLVAFLVAFAVVGTVGRVFNAYIDDQRGDDGEGHAAAGRTDAADSVATTDA